MTTPYLHTGTTRLMTQVKADLIRHEAFREFAYPDPLSPIGKKYRGKDWPWGFVPARELLARIKEPPQDGNPWTVGIGNTHGTSPDSRIDRIRAERHTEEKILNIHNDLSQLIAWYSQAPFVVKTVLINMAFNMGVSGLLKFRNTLRYMGQGMWDKAAANMEQSLWYRQVPSRARELVERIRTQAIRPEHIAKPVQ